ncbi:MAG: hypothetical protein LBB38_04700 [Puniceicoccales bacterium]|nr:hypothetical protein [Puniceicoccales bacterium]
MSIDFSQFAALHHAPQADIAATREAYGNAASAGSVDCRHPLCKAVSPLNLIWGSKFAIHEDAVVDVPVQIRMQDVLDDFGILGVLDSAVEVGTKAVLPLVAAGHAASSAAGVIATASPIGAAITVAEVGMRSYMLLNGALHQDELWRCNGYRLFATPIADARFSPEFVLTMTSAASCCGLMAARFVPCRANEGNFFSPAQVAALRSHGFVSTSMHPGSNSIAYRNPFSGECFVVTADRISGRVFFMPTVLDGIVGSEAGGGATREIAELYSEEDQRRIDDFLETARASGGLEAVAGRSGLSPAMLRRAAAIEGMRSRRAKFAYGQTATLAILSGAVVPACFKKLEFALRITMAACRDRAIAFDLITLTGFELGGSIAQFLALKYGVYAHCFAPIGIGAASQNSLGFPRIAKNAPKVFNYEVRCSEVGEVAAKVVDGAAYTLVGMQTAGIFGEHYAIDLPPGVIELTLENVADVMVHVGNQVIINSAE